MITISMNRRTGPVSRHNNHVRICTVGIIIMWDKMKPGCECVVLCVCVCCVCVLCVCMCLCLLCLCVYSLRSSDSHHLVDPGCQSQSHHIQVRTSLREILQKVIQ